MPQRQIKNTDIVQPKPVQKPPLSKATEQPDPDKTVKNTPKKFYKKPVFWLSIVLVVLLILTAGIYYFFIKPTAKIERVDQTTKTIEEKPVLVASPLTGVGVTPDEAKKPIVAVVIENLYPDARPQAGLASAGIVYEVLAEGGITRHLAIFQSVPKDIGPVRSLRPYFAYWGVEYNAPVVHAGGSAEALALISQINMKNLDQFANGKYFRRINSRPSPHNLFIYPDKLSQMLLDRNYSTKPDFTPWPRKDDQKSAQPTTTTITLDFSGYDYQAKFSYNPVSNDYTRYIRGAAAVDQNDNAPIKPKVVVVMQVSMSLSAQSASAQMIGSGQAWVFQDGTVTKATWRKTTPSQRTQILDPAGKEIALNRGQTWFSILPTGKTPTYN